MADVETLAERIQTVERAVTDGATEFPDTAGLADVESRIESLEERVDEIADRTSELEAATQALRGYVGNVRSVNEDVEQRADAALAATERLERELASERDGRRHHDRPGTERSPPGERTRTDDPTERRRPSSRTDGSPGPDPCSDRSSDNGTARDPGSMARLERSIEDSDDAEPATATESRGFLARIREHL